MVAFASSEAAKSAISMNGIDIAGRSVTIELARALGDR